MIIKGPGESPLVLLNVIKLIERCGIPYAIIGAFAASFYGVVRTSLDADAVISLVGHQEKLAELLAVLKKKGYQFQFHRGDFSDPISGVINIEDKHGNRVDLLTGIRKMPEIHERIVSMTFRGQRIKIVGIEDFIAMKIYAGSAKDIQDAMGALQISAKRINVPLLKRLTRQYGKREFKKLEELLSK